MCICNNTSTLSTTEKNSSMSYTVNVFFLPIFIYFVLQVCTVVLVSVLHQLTSTICESSLSCCLCNLQSYYVKNCNFTEIYSYFFTYFEICQKTN